MEFRSAGVVNTLVVLIACSLAQGTTSLLGTQFTVWQSSNGLVISGKLISTPPNEDTEYNALFSNTLLCGNRCRLTQLKDSQSQREVVIVPHTSGLALALFTDVNTPNFTLLDQYTLQQQSVSCSFASVVYQLASRPKLVAVCLGIDQMWLFEVGINFGALNQSSLRLLNFDHIPFSLESSSPVLFYDGDIDPVPYIIWFNLESLFQVDIAIDSPFVLDIYDVSNTCSGENVLDIRLTSNQLNLLVYCLQNTLINIDMRSRGTETKSKGTKKQFYCMENNFSVYLEQRVDTLALVSPPNADLIIPFPLNSNENYVGDCILTSETTYFIATSMDGIVVLTDVPANQTTVLATGPGVSHQLVDRRVLLFSNSTISGVIDLACPNPSTPLDTSNQTFLLTAFVLNPDYMCSREKPVTETTAPPHTATTLSTAPPTNPPTAVTTDLSATLPTTVEGSQSRSLGIGLGVGLPAVFIVAAVLMMVMVTACCLCCNSSKPPVQKMCGRAVRNGQSEDESVCTVNSQAALLPPDSNHLGSQEGTSKGTGHELIQFSPTSFEVQPFDMQQESEFTGQQSGSLSTSAGSQPMGDLIQTPFGTPTVESMNNCTPPHVKQQSHDHIPTLELHEPLPPIENPSKESALPQGCATQQSHDQHVPTLECHEPSAPTDNLSDQSGRPQGFGTSTQHSQSETDPDLANSAIASLSPPTGPLSRPPGSVDKNRNEGATPAKPAQPHTPNNNTVVDTLNDPNTHPVTTEPIPSTD